MSEGFSSPLVGGGGGLVYPAIHSPNFVHGISGWTINKDGSAEFDSLAIGSTTAGTTTIDMHGNIKVVNSHGAVVMYLSSQLSAFFQYQDLGTSAQGPLILAIASTSGSDPVNGTAYIAGMTGIDPAFGDVLQTVGANITFSQVAYTRNADMNAFTGSGATQPKLQLDAPEQTQASHLQLWMTGESPDASKPAQLILAAVAGAGVLSPMTAALLEIQGDVTVKGIIKAIVSGAVETWHAMSPLTGGWSNTGGQTTPAQYRLEPDNSVWIVGDISGGTITDGTAIFALPAGYRPAHDVIIPLLTGGGTAAPANVPNLYIFGSAGGSSMQVNHLPASTNRIAFNAKLKLDA